MSRYRSAERVFTPKAVKRLTFSRRCCMTARLAAPDLFRIQPQSVLATRGGALDGVGTFARPLLSGAPNPPPPRAGAPATRLLKPAHFRAWPAQADGPLGFPARSRGRRGVRPQIAFVRAPLQLDSRALGNPLATQGMSGSLRPRV